MNRDSPFELIRDGEVLMSNQLIGRVIATGKGAGAARQSIRRMSEDRKWWRSSKLALPGNSRLFATHETVGCESFLTEVSRLLDDTRPGLARCIRVLAGSKLLLRSEAQRLLSSPYKTKAPMKYPSWQDEWEALLELRAAVIEEKNSALERLSVPAIAGTAESRSFAIERASRAIVESNLGSILTDRFRRQNLISWNSAALPNHEGVVPFNNFVFTGAAFSRLGPLLRNHSDKKGPSPTPVVLDVYARVAEVEDIESLIERIARAGQNPRGRLQILGIVAAYGFTREAWKQAKDANLMSINIKDMFGDAALETMAAVERLLKGTYAEAGEASGTATANLAKAMEQIGANPFVKDLRSLGFEALAALILRSRGWENVRLNTTVPFSAEGGETYRELDVTGCQGNEVRVIECKAEGRGVLLDPAYVRKFFTESVPAYLKNCGGQPPEKCMAEIWTTGVVGEEAMNALADIKLRRSIAARLVGHEEVLAEIPKSLGSCERLLAAIAAR